MRNFSVLLVLLGFAFNVYSQAPSFGWASSLCNQYSNDNYDAIGIGPSGEAVVGGEFAYNIDFDPGPADFYISPSGSIFNIFIQKFDAQGNWEWALHFQDGGNTENLIDIEVDQMGNIYALMRFINNVDLDPGPAVFNLSLSNPTLVLVKLSPTGSFLWHRVLGEGFWNQYAPRDFVLDDNGNFFIAGEYADSVDVDPGVGEHWLVPGSTGRGIFYTHLNPNGDFVAAEQFWATVNTSLRTIALDPHGKIWLGGDYIGQSNFGTANSYQSTNNNHSDAIILQLDSLGSPLQVHQLSGFYRGFVSELAADSSGVYATGAFKNIFDFDPGPGTQNLTSISSNYDGFLLKLDLQGGFQWVQGLNYSGSGSTPDVPDLALAQDNSVWVKNLAAASPYNQIFKFDRSNGTQQWIYSNWFEPRFLENHGPNLYMAGDYRDTRNFHPTGTYDQTACASFGAPNSQRWDAFLVQWKDCNNSYDTLQASTCDTYVSPWGQSLSTTGQFTGVIPNAVGCDSVITVDLTVMSAPPVEAGANVSVCEGVPVTLLASGANAYTWNQGVVNGQPFVPSTSGYYVVTGIGGNGCTAKDSLYLNISPKPNAFVANNGGDLTAYPAGQSYQWISCDSNVVSIAGATQQIFSPNGSGYYAVVVDSGGCQDTSDCMFVLDVGISEHLDHSLDIYPQPAHESVKVEWSAVLPNVRWRLSDINGRTLTQGRCENCSSTTLELSSFASGVYLLEWESNNALFRRRVLVK